MSGEEQTIVVMSDQVIWRDNPTLQGGKLALLVDDPTLAGPVVMRFKIPANTKHQPHSHPHAEVVTVLSGKIGCGEGEKFDASAGRMGEPGTFAMVPANRPHFVWTENEEAVVQVQSSGRSVSNLSTHPTTRATNSR
jgi:uncharacterized RmlC-like cupin family protein